MFECLIMGDSLAVGTSYFRKECTTIAKSGINSEKYLTDYTSDVPFNTKTAIISLGSNDTPNIDTYENVLKLRKKINAQKVYWILPAIKEWKRKHVWMVAHEFGDSIIDPKSVPMSPDHVHPTFKGYRELAEETK